MTAIDDHQQAGPAGVTYQDLLDTDTHEVPVTLRRRGTPDLGTHDIPVSRYTSRSFFELEKERLWSRVWQMACREEELAEVGDTVVYDICDRSWLLVRSAPGEIKAFVNACLHRGRQLREHDGSAAVLQCPFHGFTWTLQGELDFVPCEWDFPQMEGRRDEYRLPEAKVGTWGGFVFINPDPDAEPLETFLEGLDEHFEPWPLERRYKQAHVAKVIRANWKVVQEAFMEAFHVVTTHPQLLAGIGDANSQYDAWGNFSRAITPNGTPSPHISWQPTEQEMFDAMVDRRLDEPPLVEVPDGATARQISGTLARESLRPVIGDAAADALSDAEGTDSFYFTVFPNLHPWGAYNRITYRFRPNGDDHRSAIMECMFLAPFTGERPPPAKVRWIGPDDDFGEATELGFLARVFNQDCFNLPKVQAGLESGGVVQVTFANYQETKLRHFHGWLERFVATPQA